MKRSWIATLLMVLTCGSIADARGFARRLLRRPCCHATTVSVRPQTSTASRLSTVPRYEYRCDGNTCHRVRVD